MTFLELERRCKRRRFFRVLKILFLVTLTLGALLFLDKSNFLKNQKLIKSDVKEKKEEKKVENKIIDKIEKNETDKKNIEKVEKNIETIEEKSVETLEKKDVENKNEDDQVLELTFEVNFEELYQSYKNSISAKLKEKAKLKQENKTVKTSEKTDKPKEEQLEKKPIKSKELPPYETCIKLAKEYYEKGDYKQALEWAKNANMQDNTKPSSWIITAKTLYKIGKKDEAVKLLEIYYSYTKNEKIKNLIKNMK